MNVVLLVVGEGGLIGLAWFLVACLLLLLLTDVESLHAIVHAGRNSLDRNHGASRAVATVVKKSTTRQVRLEISFLYYKLI